MVVDNFILNERDLVTVVASLQKENELLRQRNEALQATLNKNREPDGMRYEQVAEWLRGRGYTVTKIDDAAS